MSVHIGGAMTGYLIRRLFWVFPVLFFVATITFLLMHRVPGGPWSQDRPLAANVQLALNRKYHLDKPVIVQYGYFLADLLHGDLGVSFQERDRPVTQILARGITRTAQLGVLAFLVAAAVGMILGTLAAFNQNGPLDYLSVFFGTIGASFPSFIIAMFLILIFAV